ncbi:MAG: ASKHA domain-containing protein [bacterium]|nr:ASKHA domain-containing protein [bacterium]
MRTDIGKIEIKRENILRALHCGEDSPVYERISGEVDKVISEAAPEARVYISHEDKLIYVLVTVGNEISRYSRELMERGECIGGLAADTVGDEVLFSADNRVSDYLKEYLAEKNLGVLKRMQAPEDFPLSRHAEIIEKTGAEDVGLTEAYMFDPPKTMAYILELTEDSRVFKAQHDCSKCPNLNCPRRSVKAEKMEALTEHGEVSCIMVRDVMCIDIGTTTLAFERIRNGRRSTVTAVNSQRQFGADVISRLEASNAGRGRELKQKICYQLIEGVRNLYRGGEQPEKIIVSANTTMVHLLMGYSCQTLGSYPFEPYNKEIIETDFKTLTGSGICNAPVTIIGAVSGFVGGDIVSGMYMCDFDISERINLFVDLGTNGEMSIGNAEGILVTSTAAGPAFEGGRISCGTGSVDGAVYAADFAEHKISTINDKPPVGICGTGIVEVMAELIKSGAVDKTGLLRDEYFETGYPVTERLRFTQKDIREIQTAKAAVRAGIELLIERYGCTYEDVASVYIAGGFGCKLNISKACEIGLIPPELEMKCTAIGNSSLGGAVKYAFSMDAAARTGKLRGLCRELVLAADEDFNDRYLEYMNF